MKLTNKMYYIIQFEKYSDPCESLICELWIIYGDKSVNIHLSDFLSEYFDEDTVYISLEQKAWTPYLDQYIEVISITDIPNDHGIILEQYECITCRVFS